MKREALVDIVSYLFILLFGYAAFSKLLDYSTFKVQLSQSPITTKYANFLAWALPTVEIVVACSMIFKLTRLVGLYASLFLMTAFSSYIFLMLHYSFYIPCSCGGILGKMNWNTHFWFNIFFVISAVSGIALIEVPKIKASYTHRLAINSNH